MPLGARQQAAARACHRAFQAQVETLVLNANGDARRFARFGLPVIADYASPRIGEFAGPQAGALAGSLSRWNRGPSGRWNQRSALAF